MMVYILQVRKATTGGAISITMKRTEDIQAGKCYYVTFTFKKTNTVGTLTLYTQAEYADHWYDSGPDDVSTLTVTVESP